VLSLRRDKEAAHRAAGEQVIHHPPGQVLFRPGCGRLLGVR